MNGVANGLKASLWRYAGSSTANACAGAERYGDVLGGEQAEQADQCFVRFLVGHRLDLCGWRTLGALEAAAPAD